MVAAAVARGVDEDANVRERSTAPAQTSLHAGPLEILIAEAQDLPLSEPRMQAWAARFARALPAGSVLALEGDLGAGKTSFVRSCCQALAVHDLGEVTSPTYALVHEYPSAHGSVIHADLYRLRQSIELDQIGWEELLDGAHVAFVEWPDRAAERLPARTMRLQFSHVPQEPHVRALHIALPPAR